LDFDKYKPRLKEYLRQKGVDVTKNPTHCFNAAGHKHGDANPSLQIFDDSYKCYGCGIQGDVYDAVEILEGIKDKKEQYEFVEQFFNGCRTVAAIKQPAYSKGADSNCFKPDAAAMKAFESFLLKNERAAAMIKLFLDTRAQESTAGAVQEYPAEIEKYIVDRFFYWSGLDAARETIGNDILKKCGIPLVNPKTGHSTWEHSGVVMRIGTGYKLHWYEKIYCNKCKEVSGCKKYKTPKGSCYTCEKRTSKGGKTFPMPGAVDKTKPVILVEGEMNAFSCAAIGIENLFSCGGTNGLTAQNIAEYLLDVPEIIVCYDADSSGRQAGGLEPFGEDHPRLKNTPDKLLAAGYTGKIRIAELPPVSETGQKDQDGLILAGKRDVIIKAISDAKEYVPPERGTKNKNTNGKGAIWQAYDSISVERLRALLGKIDRANMDAEDIQPFISACVKACKHSNAKKELMIWDAKQEEIEAENDTSPYFLLEMCGKYGVSKYLKREIEKSLVPESEMLKTLKEHDINIKIDYDNIVKSENVKQFMRTRGVRSAAEVVYEVIGKNIVYTKSENRFYLFNGHIWEYEPDMTGMIYKVLCLIIRYYMFHKLEEKEKLWELRLKVEGRRYRVEIMQDFSEFHDIHMLDTNFDSPVIKETITLADGVIDFSGSEIKYRKSLREEFRRHCLPYTMAEVKSVNPKMFLKFMEGNFKNAATMETLLYYLSLIPSRNTQFKYGGIFIGKPHTGKTTTIELIRMILSSTGNDKKSMIETIPAGVLITQGRRRDSGNEATPYIAMLEGKGAGVASETEKGGLLNNAQFKLLTGGDTLSARGLYQAPRSFTPTAQIIILTNHSPRFDAQDAATVDRMVIIPFSVEHKKSDNNAVSQGELINSLRHEYAGIIRLLAEYYLRLRIEFNGAIPFSDECLNYKNNYIDEQRTDLDKFVNENIEFGLGGEYFEKVEDLYNRFLKYYDISEEDAEKETLPRKKFTYLLRRDYLEMKNYKPRRFGDKILPCFFNIKLKPFDENAERPAPHGYYDKQTGDLPAKQKRVQDEQSIMEENPF
jgi:phage/plasmid-associated DNA primase